MTLDEYQLWADTKCPDLDHVSYQQLDPMQAKTVCLSLGLAGEAGEFADYIKKVVFHLQEVEEDKLVKELGDVLWYLSVLAYHLGFTMDEIVKANIKKLDTRYQEGFSPEDSLTRRDLNGS